MGRPAYEIVLSEQQREDLERWRRGRTVSRQLAFRSKLILLCAQGLGTLEVADKLGASAATVSKWRKRFALQGSV